MSKEAAQNYLPRHINKRLHTALADTPVVALLGPRQCGKSTLAIHLAPERAYITLDEHNMLMLAQNDPQGFIAELPERVTIDEVQRAPELLLAIKHRVDRNRKAGRFLLTGSANLMQIPRLADSLAGRMEIIELQPFSEAEKERTPGRFLQQWMAGTLPPRPLSGTKTQASKLPQRVIAGGYPEACKRSPKRAQRWLRQYVKALVERDVRDINQIKAAGDILRFVEYLAFQNAQLLNLTSIAKALGHTRATVEKYLTVLEKLYLLRRLPAWHKNSAKRLLKTPKLYFRDSGLAASLSGLTASSWLTDRTKFGMLLESFAVQQLWIQADQLDARLQLYHYRDKDQVEVDCVLCQGQKLWGVEIKAAKTLQQKDGKGLRRLADQAGQDFQGGVLFYDGSDILPLDKKRKLLAAPLSLLWEL